MLKSGKGVGFGVLAASMVAASVMGSRAQAAATFVGSAFLPPSATDVSGLSGTLEDGSPENLLSFGSGITYSGSGNLYYALPDRGPNALKYDANVDNTTSWKTRYEKMQIVVDYSTFNGTAGSGSVSLQNVGTTLLTNEAGQNLIGLSSAYTGYTSGGTTNQSANSATSGQNLRYDPEAIVRSSDGKYVYVSDEYGPNVYKFDATTGQRVGVVTLPARYYISNLSSTGSTEVAGNTSGRQANRGMEGLAINPSGTALYGIMQNALIQDHALDASNSRVGLNNRIVKVDLTTGTTSEYVYHLEGKNYGVNEMLAVNDHQFLVIERDGKDGDNAAFKKIYLIDLNGATDVSSVNSLPQGSLSGSGITAVGKTEFIDLLATLKPFFTNNDFPEKFEGLAWGQDVDTDHNGQLDAHTLLVTTDNDFVGNSYAFAYAIPYADLPGFQAQAVPEAASLGMLGIGAVALLRRKR